MLNDGKYLEYEEIESLWKEVSDAVQEDGLVFDESEAVTMTRQTAERLLSSEAVAQAMVRDNGQTLIWDGNIGRGFVIYDLLKHVLLPQARDEADKARYRAVMRKLEWSGPYDYPGYFGPYAPPEKTPLGAASFCETVANGIFLLYAGGQWVLAVHTLIVDTEMQIGFFDRVGIPWEDFLFFYGTSFAIAVYDLYRERPETIERYLTSRDALFAHLYRFCRDQVDFYHCCLRESIKTLTDSELDYSVLLQHGAIPFVDSDADEPYFRFPLFKKDA